MCRVDNHRIFSKLCSKERGLLINKEFFFCSHIKNVTKMDEYISGIIDIEKTSCIMISIDNNIGFRHYKLSKIQYCIKRNTAGHTEPAVDITISNYAGVRRSF